MARPNDNVTRFPGSRRGQTGIKVFSDTLYFKVIEPLMETGSLLGLTSDIYENDRGDPVFDQYDMNGVHLSLSELEDGSVVFQHTLVSCTHWTRSSWDKIPALVTVLKIRETYAEEVLDHADTSV